MKKKWIAAGGIAAVFIIIGSIAAISLRQTSLVEVDLTKNIVMDFSGVNGDGKAKVLSNHLELDSSNENYTKFSQSLTYQIEPSEGLWNGDEIRVTVSYNESYRKIAGLQPINPEMVCVTEGLETPKLSSDTVPSSMQYEGVDEVFKAYMDAIENAPDDEPEADLSGIWITGQDPEAPKKEQQEFLFEDYTDYMNDAFDQAKEYGRTSSQNYRVQPVMNGDSQIGWKTVFQDE